MDAGADEIDAGEQELEARRSPLAIDMPEVGDEAGDDRAVSSATTSRNRRVTALVTQKIKDAKSSGAISLDLSHKELKEIPEELLELVQLQYLYLEGNQLTHLPDTFFDCLPSLKWLDLRRNYLVWIPNLYIGRHENLQNLLLEGNELKTLPLELGLIKTLSGLNICNNPLEFPPVEIIERGTKGVLQFFREMLLAKSQGKLPTTEEEAAILDRIDVPKLEDLRLNDTTDSDSEASSDDHHKGNTINGTKSQYGQNYLKNRTMSFDSHGSLSDFTNESDLVGPIPQTLALHKPMSYNEIKQTQYEKFRRAGALGKVDKKAARKVRSHGDHQVSRYPVPLPSDKIEQRYLEERRLHKLRELKQQQDLILQRRKDNEMLKEWRDEGKRLQRVKYRSKVTKGTKEYPDAARDAPFGVEEKHMKIHNKEEQIAQDIREKHEKMRQVLSPRSRLRMEEARAARDRELQSKIKDHTAQMKDRRRQVKGTPQDEMQAAKRELAIAAELQRELELRRKALEYRFQAFTGDV